MKIFIAGGGTGGHVYPAVAIANELKYRHADWEIEFVGRSDSIEGRVAKQEGYLLHNIDVIGYERFLGKIEKTRVILKLCKSMFESMSLIRKHKPDMVIGTGGYVCGPIVYVAALKKLPTLITEQNVIPGFTIKTLSKVASRVCVSFPETVNIMARPERCIVTGNPVRREFGLFTKEIARKTLKLKQSDKFLLIFGGSLGASSINEAVKTLLWAYKDDKNVHIVHVTGDETFEEYKRSLKEEGLDTDKYKNINILSYTNDMPLLLNAADLVICRSGATTIAEVNYVGVAAIYIPYPYAANDHQMKNAISTRDKGASVVIKNDELSGKILATAVESLLKDDKLLSKMALKSRSMGIRNSTQLLCDEIEEILSTV